MQKNSTKKDEAVSPVVAVMLMLVVTIIIAAVVSSFASGLTDTTGKTSSVVLSGELSQSNGLIMKHVGGGSLGTADLTVRISPTSEFGAYTHLSWALDNEYIFNNAKDANLYADKGIRGSAYSNTDFTSGDEANTSKDNYKRVETGWKKLYNPIVKETDNGNWTVNASTSAPFTGVSTYASGDLFCIAAKNVQKQGDGAVEVKDTSAYNFLSSESIGKHVNVEVYQNGKLISTTSVPITA